MRVATSWLRKPSLRSLQNKSNINNKSNIRSRSNIKNNIKNKRNISTDSGLDQFKNLPTVTADLRSIVAGSEVAVTSEPALQRVLTDPSTNQPLNKWQAASKDDVNEAVMKAKEAQKEWAQLSGLERGVILRRAAELLRDNARNDAIAYLETRNTGRPYSETKLIDVVSARDAFDYFGGVAATIAGSHVQMPGGSFAYTRREPIGVAGGICGFNYPIQGAAWKAAPALACGNAIVVKPAEDTPHSALALAQVLQEAGLPDGLYNVVLGDGEVGDALTTHPGISKISFTGSVGTGKKICERAVGTSTGSIMKKVTMELGGKSPLLVFADSDLEAAVTGTLMGNYLSVGEVCSNCTRVYVEKSIHDQFVERLVERINKLKTGHPMNPENHIGPVITAKHRQKVLDYIRIGATEDNATLRCGTYEAGQEHHLSDPELRDEAHKYKNSDANLQEDIKLLKSGNYVKPALFTGCTDDMRIMREEIFGPVCCVATPFESEEEAIHRANDTNFGLAAGVFTKDAQRAHRVSAALEAGIVYINNYNLSPVEVPWGGYKDSGVGRENGLAAIDSWTQLKTVHVEQNDVWSPFP